MREDLSQTEENYLKTIYQQPADGQLYVSTNQIAQKHSTSAASVTDMLKRLAEKGLLHYEKYQGVKLTDEGDQIAKALIRKHRLWEYFLVERLSFGWEEVHAIAEQLEHIKSTDLTDRLDAFLGYPKYDPHGDPIPDKAGRYAYRSDSLLQDFQPGQQGIVVGVKNSDAKFLQLLESTGLTLGATVKVLQVFEFDHSLRLEVNESESTHVSADVGRNLYIKRL